MISFQSRFKFVKIPNCLWPKTKIVYGFGFGRFGFGRFGFGRFGFGRFGFGRFGFGRFGIVLDLFRSYLGRCHKEMGMGQ